VASVIGVALLLLAVIGFPLSVIGAFLWFPGAWRRNPARTLVIAVIVVAVVLTGVLIVGSSATI